MADGNDGVGANLAVARFLNEALAGCRVDHQTVADGGFNKERCQSEAVFIGAGPRTELDPVHLNGVGADHLCGLQSFARCARMVGGSEFFVQARIMFHTHLDILAEAAGGKQHALRGTDVVNLTGLFTTETIVTASLHAQNGTGFGINDQFVNDRAKLHGNAVFLALLVHRDDEAGTGIVVHGVAARHGVTAVESHGLELHADLLEPVIVFHRTVGDVAGQIRVSQAAAGLDDVGKEKIGVVLDAGSLLHIGAGSSHCAAVDD